MTRTDGHRPRRNRTSIVRESKSTYRLAWRRTEIPMAPIMAKLWKGQREKCRTVSNPVIPGGNGRPELRVSLNILKAPESASGVDPVVETTIMDQVAHP
jgi:hypothetical protein